MTSADDSSPRDVTAPALPLLAVAGFSSLVSMRLCDAMLPAPGAAFDTRTTEAATVISSFAVAYGLMQLVYGPLGDRYGKPRVIGFAAVWCTLATLGAAMAPTLQTLAVARAAMGGGAAAIVPLTLAWIGDHVSLERRQEVLARYSGATLSGMVIGTWAGGLVTDMLGWRAAFVFIAPLFAIAALGLLRHARREAPAPTVSQLSYWRRVSELLALPWTRFVLLTAFIEGAFAYGSLAFVPSVLHERFALPLGKAGAVLALFALGGLVFSRASRVLIRRISPPALARLGAALMASGFALLAVMPHWGFALAGCALGGLGFYAFHNMLQVSATQLSTTSRGLGVSFFACSIFLGQSIGVTIAAIAFAKLPPAACFGTAGVALAVLGVVYGYRLRAREDPATSGVLRL